MKVLQLLFLTILLSQPRLQAAEAAPKFPQVFRYNSTANEWEGWRPVVTFTNEKSHIVTIWQQFSSAGSRIVSFSLRHNNPAHFEFITNYEETEQRTGPNIYWANGYIHYTDSLNSRTLDSLESRAATFKELSKLLLIELNKISAYNEWRQEKPWSDAQLKGRVFKWVPERNQWMLREDAPNPLLAFKLYERCCEAREGLPKKAKNHTLL